MIYEVFLNLWLMKKTLVGIAGAVILGIIAYVFITANRGTSNENPSTSSQESSGLVESSKEASPSSMRKTYETPPVALDKSQIEGKKVRIKTAKGDIVFELFSDSPIAASNFIFLTNEKFYDGLTFHRREEGFVIQGGDPVGNGTGGPGYQFADEPVTKDYKRGIVAMANAGPNTNGSQFFIMLADTPLPKSYTVFGSVISGMDVVDKIQVGDVMEKVTEE